MCGIVGLYVFEDNDIDEQMRREALIYIATEALQLTQSRGEDATGVTTLFEDGNYMGLKMSVHSTDFVHRFGGKEDDFEGFLKIWRENNVKTRSFIGHCRKSSVGNTWDNVNNHPIKVKDIVGVHNGTLKNHDKIFENLKCKRDGTVDSEAIFRLLAHYSEDCTLPFTKDMILEVTSRLEGSFACLALNCNNPYQGVVFRDDRPVEMVLIKPLKAVFISSETKILKQTLARFNKSIHLYNLHSRDFRISEKVLDFKMLPNRSIAIFDLTKNITEHTNIEDLYEKGDIPIKKKWDEFKADKKAKEKIEKEANDKKEEKERLEKANSIANTCKINKTAVIVNKFNKKFKAKSGFVWNNALKVYKHNIADVELNKGNGAIEIDTVKGDFEDIKFDDKKSINENKYELTVSKNIENLIGGTSKIEDISKADKILEDGIVEDVVLTGEIVDDNNTEIETTAVDCSIDPDAYALAEKFVNQLNRYKNDEELSDAIDLESTEVLDQLSHYALANRVTSYAAKWSFYKGVLISNNDTISQSEEDKTGNIRRFKKMVLQIAKMLDKDPTDETSKGQVIDKGIRALLVKDKEMNEESLKSIFSAGDIRSSFTIRRLMSTARNVNNGGK